MIKTEKTKYKTYKETIELTKEERETLKEPKCEECSTESRVIERIEELALQNIDLNINFETITDYPKDEEFKDAIEGLMPNSVNITGEAELLSLDKSKSLEKVSLELITEEKGIYVIKMNKNTEKVIIELPIHAKTKRIGKNQNYIIFTKN